jgi:Cu+-exporting ATPase
VTATEIVLAVQGMHCASCGLLIDEALEDLAGVSQSTTSVRGASTTVLVDLTACPVTRVLAEISDLGYTAQVTPASGR